MKVLLIILTLVFSINTSFAQLQGQAKIDSLLKELPKMIEDTNKVKLLQILSFEYYQINPDYGIKYGDKGLQLSESINWSEGKANCYNTLGLIYSFGKSNYPKALEYLNKALLINKKINNKIGIASNYGNFGHTYLAKGDYSKAFKYLSMADDIFLELNNLRGIGLTKIFKSKISEYQSNYPEALEYLQIALNIFEKSENKTFLGFAKENIGNIYSKQFKFELTIKYYDEALKLYKNMEDKLYTAKLYGNYGALYKEKLVYSKSLEFYNKSLKIHKELGNLSGISEIKMNIGDLYTDLNDFKKSSKFLNESLELNLEIGNLRLVALTYDLMTKNYLKQAKYYKFKKLNVLSQISFEIALDYGIKSISLADSIGLEEIKYKIYEKISQCYENLDQINNALYYYKKHVQSKDSIYSIKNSNKLNALEKNREKDLNKLKIEKQEIRLKAQEDEKQLILFSSGGALLAVFIILTLIINQRRKSEKLLLNILPASIAKRLKAKEKNIADDFDKATTVFIDLVGFTSFAKDKKASEVVKVLNKIFHRFDDLVKKHGLEKIKTMGDGYLAVAGVPDPVTNHCQKAIDFALDVRKELEKFNSEMGLDINARIGLESGPLVAGVIGSSKFIYDIWGDSVNTASRMESTGTPGKIQITENVKSELEKHATDLQFEKREAFEVKGKGLMQTYYLD